MNFIFCLLRYLSESSSLFYRDSNGHFIFSSATERISLISQLEGFPIGENTWEEEINGETIQTYDSCSLPPSSTLSTTPSKTPSAIPSSLPTENCVALSFACNSEYDGLYQQTDSRRFQSLTVPFQRLFVDDTRWVFYNPSLDTYLYTDFNNEASPPSPEDWSLGHTSFGDVGTLESCMTQCLSSFFPTLAPIQPSRTPSKAPSFKPSLTPCKIIHFIFIDVM